MSRYETAETLGEGGMGEVTRARDAELERDVALKVLRADLAADPGYVARFIHEAQATGRLEHPYIPAVHELGRKEDGRPFYAMKLVEGEPLTEIIRRLRVGDRDTHAKFTFTRRAQIVQQVAEAAHYAHQQKIVHRDLKPANIMVGKYGEVYVVDWGLARSLKAKAKRDFETESGMFMGTVPYSPPEQMAGEAAALAPTADVYAIGALFYELVTLHPPYHDEKDAQKQMAAILTRDPVKPDTFSNHFQGRVPREISVIIERALKRDPKNRFQTAAEMAQAIQVMLQGESDPVCPHTFCKRQLTRLGKLLDNHGLAVTIAIAVWTLLPLVLGGALAVQWFAP